MIICAKSVVGLSNGKWAFTQTMIFSRKTSKISHPSFFLITTVYCKPSCLINLWGTFKSNYCLDK